MIPEFQFQRDFGRVPEETVGEAERYQCLYCFKNFPSLGPLKNHLRLDCAKRRECEVDSKFQCPTCLRIYKHSRNLWRHQKYECGKLPSFFCPYCTYACKRKSQLEEHIEGFHKVPVKKNRPKKNS